MSIWEHVLESNFSILSLKPGKPLVVLECKGLPSVCVEAPEIFYLLRLVCLQNQYHVGNTKACLQLEKYQGSFGPWLQPLNSLLSSYQGLVHVLQTAWWEVLGRGQSIEKLFAKT